MILINIIAHTAKKGIFRFIFTLSLQSVFKNGTFSSCNQTIDGDNNMHNFNIAIIHKDKLLIEAD